MFLYDLFWFSLVSFSCLYMLNPKFAILKMNEIRCYLEDVHETFNYQYLRVKTNTINYLVDTLPENIVEKFNLTKQEELFALEDDNHEVDYIGFNNYDDTKELYIDEDDDRNILEDKKLMMIGLYDNDKRYYKRIENYSGLLFNADFIYPTTNEEIFLQVEVELGEDKIDIHKKLDVFYVVGNKLFDRVFMEWFMDKHFDRRMEPNEEYKVNIIDKYVKMFTLKENEVVEIVIENDKTFYKVVEHVESQETNEDPDDSDSVESQEV